MRFDQSIANREEQKKLTSTLDALRRGCQGLHSRGAGDEAAGGSRGADSRADEGAREGGERGQCCCCCCWSFDEGKRGRKGAANESEGEEEVN